MKDLKIEVFTDLSPAKVNLHDLLCSIEHLIETEYEGVCRRVEFHEVSRPLPCLRCGKDTQEAHLCG